MTAPLRAAATAAAMVLNGLCAVPRPLAAASTNRVQAGISVARATVTARGALPGGSGFGGPAEGNGCPPQACMSASTPNSVAAAIATCLMIRISIPKGVIEAASSVADRDDRVDKLPHFHSCWATARRQMSKMQEPTAKSLTTHMIFQFGETES